jgi:uncharacterized NAD(P)/FAD-binding protein YdhS
MDKVISVTRIAIIGGGPSALFLYKQLVGSGHAGVEVTIFERNITPGAGMPYSTDGANEEHVTNVSGNEIPELVSSLREWIRSAPHEYLARFDMVPEKFSEYKVVPRLLFGKYLSDQFALLQEKAKKTGIITNLLVDTEVTDIEDDPANKTVKVITANSGNHQFDVAIISTGHCWPLHHEGKVPNYFDSPYPPHKLKLVMNAPVAIRGSSLTAIDAVRTLARQHGQFIRQEDGRLTYTLSANYPHFKLVMHSLGGLLPAIRFHLEDPRLHNDATLTAEAIHEIKAANAGFIPLDYLFQKHFKEGVREQDPAFYEKIKDMSIEEFVDSMMALRERLDPFVLFKAEYAEAEKSIKRKEPVYWKEMLASLSFAMNAPAKHFSAEDMLRLKEVLMPLISIVIAFVPQTSCDELLALYDAGILSVVAVDRSSKVTPRPEGGIVYTYTDEEGQQQSQHYEMFVDCLGQTHFMYNDFPFKSLLDNGSISPARLKFRTSAGALSEKDKGNALVKLNGQGDYYLQVPGVSINDNFQVIDQYGAYNDRIYIMAVPHIGGFNPDYSGLDFCEAAADRIIKDIISRQPTYPPTPA